MLSTLRLIVAATLFAASPALFAQSAYPSRPIRLIVPLAAGSAVDNGARILAQKMSIDFGQAIIVENVVGASGQIGADRVAKAAPDGYTLGGFNDSIMTMLPNIQLHLPWNILKDFAPVSLVATIEWGLVATPDSPYATVADVIAAARANPGKLQYGSGGVGSPQHVAMALFASSAGVQLTHVPYKGASQAAVGVASGEVNLAFEGLATVSSLLAGHRLKLLAVSTPARMAQYAAPTVGESGLPGFEFNSWFTIMAPAGTPKDVVDRLDAEIRRALADPDVLEKFKAQGLTPRGTSAAELGVATRAQLARYAQSMEKAGIKAE